MKHSNEPIFPENFTEADVTELDPTELDSSEIAALEAALHESLQMVDAPAGFAERVLAKANAGPVAVPRPAPAKAGPSKVVAFPGRFRTLASVPAMGAIAAGLLIAAFTGYDLHHRHEEHAQAAEATQQFDLATEITDRAVERAQERAQEQARQQLQRAGIPANMLP